MKKMNANGSKDPRIVSFATPVQEKRTNPWISGASSSLCRSSNTCKSNWFTPVINGALLSQESIQQPGFQAAVVETIIQCGHVGVIMAVLGV